MIPLEDREEVERRFSGSKEEKQTLKVEMHKSDDGDKSWSSYIFLGLSHF